MLVLAMNTNYVNCQLGGGATTGIVSRVDAGISVACEWPYGKICLEGKRLGA